MSKHDENFSANYKTTGISETARDLDVLESKLAALKKVKSDLEYEEKKLLSANKRSSKEYRNAIADLKKVSVEIRQTTKARNDELKATDLTQLSYNELKKRSSMLSAQLRNTVESIQPQKYQALAVELRQVEEQLRKVGIGMKQASGEFRTAPSMWQNTIGKIKNFLPALGISSAIASVFNTMKQQIQASIPVYMEYDDKLADVMKTTGLAKDETEAMSKNLSKINTRTSQVELLDLARVAGKLGIDSAEEVEGFVRAADKINVALSEDLGGNAEEALNQVGKLVDIFNIKQQFGIEDAMIRVGSTVNELGAASTANEGYIVDFTKRLAGVAPQANISIQNVMGYGATLDQFGQQCETSGTAMSQAITGMFKKTDVYARIAGMSVKDFTALMNKDANAAFITFLKGLKGNNDGMAAMVKNLNDLKMDGSRTTQILGALASNVETLEQQQLLANQAFADGTSIINEFNVKNNTAAAIVEKRRNAINRALADLGEKLFPLWSKTLGLTGNLLQVLTAVLGVAVKYSGVIVSLTGAVTAYVIVQKLQHFYSKANRQAMVEEVATLTGATAATKLLAAAKLLLAGNLRAAALAFKIFFASIGPIGWIVTGIAAIGSALSIVSANTNKASKSVQDLVDINKKANDTYVDEKSRLEELLRVASDKNISDKKRMEAITQLQELIPNGIELINEETIATGNAKKAVDDYCKSLLLRAKIEAGRERLKDLEKERMNAEQDGSDGKLSFSQNVWAGALYSLGFQKASKKFIVNKTMENKDEYGQMMDARMQKTQEMVNKWEKELYKPLPTNGDKPDTKSQPDLDLNKKDKGKWSIEKDAQFMKEKLALRAQLQSGELSSEQEYNDRLLTLEIASLERRIALNKEKGTDLQALQDDLADKRYKQKKSDEDRLSKLIAASLEGGKNPELQQDIDRENASYRKRLEDLGLFWKDRKDMTKEELAALENLERRHNENLRYIYIGETQRRFDANRQMAESSINALKTEHNNQLASAETFEQKKALVAQLYGDERAKRVRTENEALKLIRKKYTAEEDELARKELENLISIYQEMMTELEKVLANADVTGMTDADRDVLQQKIDDLKKQIAALKGENPSGDDKKYGDDLDILGFSRKQWSDLFDNLKSGKLSFQDWGEAIGMIGTAMANAFSTVSNLMTAIEERQFKTYEKTANKKKKTLEQQKNAGVITEATYNSKVQAIDEETERKREEMERKQAIRNKAMSVFQSLIATAVAVTQALPDVPLSIIVGALGAIQTAAILATPLPGAEQGGMINVEREQDGRRFYAEFSPNRRGYVNRPTVIVGENGPEYVIPNEMLQNPEVVGFVNAIEAARLKGEFRNPLNMPVPGRASGGYVMPPTNMAASSSAGGVAASSTVSIPPELIATLDRLNKRLDKPLPAYLRKYGSGGLYDEMNRDSKIRKTL